MNSKLPWQKKFSDLLKIGEDVALQDLDGNQTYTGKVSRINARVDRASQTIQVFIRIDDHPPKIRTVS
ncbi:HlyD family efflux transporter periplasmic adaptor subunit [Salegentibacter mishustinae]|uniref:HlyD family efflux transporter periplasmic adaptor subunit n=1 Tax=Salegentibacter mishustinae TaxID=270918 RepID=UPI00293D533B|nr:HlyD family efflux transporter periplasmic adaptor subunit [Salegentibacter mishustinae]